MLAITYGTVPPHTPVEMPIYFGPQEERSLSEKYKGLDLVGLAQTKKQEDSKQAAYLDLASVQKASAVAKKFLLAKTPPLSIAEFSASEEEEEFFFGEGEETTASEPPSELSLKELSPGSQEAYRYLFSERFKS